MSQSGFERHRLTKEDGRLVEIHSRSDGAYYFVYENGTISRVLKSDLAREEYRLVPIH